MAGSGFLMLPINGSVPRLVSSSSFSCHASAMSFSPASASVDQENPVADAFLASQERNVIRLGLPSKGRMADETLDLLKVACSFLSVCFIHWFCLCSALGLI